MSVRNKRINSECDEEDCNEDDSRSNSSQSETNITSKETSANKSNCSFHLYDESMREENEDDYNDEEDELDIFDELDSSSDDEKNENELAKSSSFSYKLNKKHCNSLSKLCISNSSLERYYYKTRQPHIIYFDFDVTNRNNSSKASVSEVLNALDMPGAVRDNKRFNYVCRLVQIIINEKLRSLSGNAQRTLFMIVKQMLIQVIKRQENLSVMRKLLIDFKKKIQDSYYYYFYYVGSQKLWEKHVSTINRWEEMLDNPNHKKVKRLINNFNKKSNMETANKSISSENKENSLAGFESIPYDCKLEIMRRLNTGLDLVNLSKCNKSLNDIVNKELAIWKNLCQFHFQQTHINSLLNNKSSKEIEAIESDLDWKSIYFKLKRRFGHREVYVDMIHKCFHCKSLFWKVS